MVSLHDIGYSSTIARLREGEQLGDIIHDVNELLVTSKVGTHLASLLDRHVGNEVAGRVAAILDIVEQIDFLTESEKEILLTRNESVVARIQREGREEVTSLLRFVHTASKSPRDNTTRYAA